MISNAEFEALLKLETKARDFYDDMLTRITNPVVREKIESIRNDEVRHMKMAQRILDLINK